jgi:hypothetical protein
MQLKLCVANYVLWSRQNANYEFVLWYITNEIFSKKETRFKGKGFNGSFKPGNNILPELKEFYFSISNNE